MIKKISISLIILTIIIVNLFRFWNLDRVPYGYNVDELSGAVTQICLETEGVDAHLNPHPMFGELHYGTPKPPVYIYPAALWSKIFGHKADSFRALTAFWNIVTLLGLFFLGRLIVSSNSYALLVVLVASISPWGWGPSRIGYEATSCVTFFIWGLFLFLRSNRWIDRIPAGLLFALAIYAYAPCRLQIPFILITLIAFYLKDHKVSKRVWAGFFITILLVCLPLLQGIFQGHLQQRFNGISIFNSDYLHSIGKSNSLYDIVGVFIHNYLLHFSFKYLFISGDPLLEHSTQHFGILSWLDILGILSLFYFLIFRNKDIQTHGKWLLFITVNFFLAIVPASLTNSELHISLRTIGALPFLSLLSGYGLWLLVKNWKIFFPITTLIGIVFAFFFLRVYFTVYPEESKGWFSFWTMEEAVSAKTEEDWLKFMVRYADQDYHYRYYAIVYRGESCSSSRAKWIKLRELMKLPKAY